MLRISDIRTHYDDYIAALKKRNFDAKVLFDQALKADDARKSTQARLDRVLADSNKFSKEIGQLFKSGEPKKAGVLKQKTAALKAEAKSMQEQLQQAGEELQRLLLEIPNVPHDDVPAGTSEGDNKEVFRHGDPSKLGKEALPHWELAKKYGLIDFELGNKVTGAGFPVYRGKGARLQRALINFFLDKSTKAGYEEYQPPLLVNEASGYGTGQLPDKEGQMYHIGEDNLYLIPTSEVPLTNMVRDQLLSPDALPLKYTAYTPCFRREAGSYGAHVRGLNRLHQFDKVEIVRIEKPEDSFRALDEMVAHVKTLLEALELPYRILLLCGGDLGFASAITYDFEVWSAAQQRWLEVSSISNFETFQANRLKLRVRDGGDKYLAHTLNGSALALPRIVAALLENNQTPRGIELPKTLAPYTGFERIG